MTIRIFGWSRSQIIKRSITRIESFHLHSSSSKVSNHHSIQSTSPRMIDLTGYGKVVIVTGCSSGIGLATVLLFLKHQYQVFGVDINAFEYKILDNLDGGQFQGRFHFHLGDLTKPGECETALRICVAEFG